MNGLESLDKLRILETELFGGVNVDKGQKSALDVALSWKSAEVSILKKEKLESCIELYHPEAGRNGMKVKSIAYLGYGPILYEKEKKEMVYKRNEIAPGSIFGMHLTFPKNRREEIERVLAMVCWFGSVGSRSRNGWGSFQMDGKFKTRPIEYQEINTALDSNAPGYPHCLGKDDKGMLAWTTKDSDSWIGTMDNLSSAYLRLRTECKILGRFSEPVAQGSDRNGNPTDDIAHAIACPRHLLGYPLTHHKINDTTWGEEERSFQNPKKVNGRYASPLRFSVRKDLESGKLFGIILHLPYRIHMAWPEDIKKQADVWKEVHNFIDDSLKLQRLQIDS